MRRLKHLDFLWDVLLLACTSFGGPQVHFALFLDRLVKKRAYLTEEELFEIQALCSVLPGPTSTQMITAIGLKLGGASLAYLTLFIWITPAVLIMTLAAYGMTFLRNNSILHYVLPVGIGLILQAGWFMAKKVITGPMYVIILLVTLFLGIAFHSPYIFPLVLVLGGVVSSLNYKDFPRQTKHKFVIPWANFHLYWGFLVALALLGHFADYFPIRLFENFYRNGSLVFGGGHILAPVLYTEFVEFKQLISSEAFLTGMALSQTLPGPVFAFTSYLGVLLMKDYGLWGELAGSLIGALGIFLPGTFLIFFVFRIWGQLKQYRFIRASLAGIQAASVGLTLVAVFTFTKPMVVDAQFVSLGIVVAAFVLAEKTKIPAILLFGLALIAGIIGI
ncbi:chromate transporter [Aquirufa antheringensis]|jgi:chromate transporter|uniref:Chromate transporter n=1 Tax=Aquirufa antheringensis TaxID=2516559 RepID=A0A4Q9B8M2_9BACT|nr:chromate transporter [Aquirufa antheringensis]MCZ2485809.1 chromate transporter [Aquirufa antheringensis]MCZ2486499.1 chromate transporter [Aquirufa antheringensis]MCZ2488720.1 chromate transporter [Aquirufa antheringensis]TBH71209.1 chromate transporter [Aquirufa antheringensis]